MLHNFYSLFVCVFCELSVLYCPIFNGDACLLNNYPIRVLKNSDKYGTFFLIIYY